jgi:hypothetical protein
MKQSVLNIQCSVTQKLRNEVLERRLMFPQGEDNMKDLYFAGVPAAGSTPFQKSQTSTCSPYTTNYDLLTPTELLDEYQEIMNVSVVDILDTYLELWFSSRIRSKIQYEIPRSCRGIAQVLSCRLLADNEYHRNPWYNIFRLT